MHPVVVNAPPVPSGQIADVVTGNDVSTKVPTLILPGTFSAYGPAIVWSTVGLFTSTVGAEQFTLDPLVVQSTGGVPVTDVIPVLFAQLTPDELYTEVCHV
jgi:hypothetical protein